MHFRDKICIIGYEALCRRKYGWKYHIAERGKNNNYRAYLCGCHRSIRIGKGEWLHPGKYTKRSNFQTRSKWNIKIG